MPATPSAPSQETPASVPARPRRIALTGGSGGIGAVIAKELIAAGHVVHNFDQTKLAMPGIHTVIIDVANFGDLISGLKSYDAIVHLAAISAPGRGSSNRIFQVNTQSTFNVLEAASILGIRHVVLASSLNAMGMTFNLKPCVHYLPLDEDHPCEPDEAYGLSKLVGETVADGFARRFPEMTICSLRFPMVVMPDFYRKSGRDEQFWKRALWSFCDAREAARAVRLGLDATWRGHEVFLLAADHTPSPVPSAELAAQWYPDVPLRSPLPGHAAFVSAAKAERMLGWKHERTFEAAMREALADAE
ncbi:MAG: NAD(P)-dependent oxidoreductase [Opitutaceae bacterium]|nr:NAD(P)-dependent oxidoreductase [Cephaloticoccus sp.]MCP5530149.1 NAD(P)-dependent oxidoreductase [Opitutaceae bacterium]